MANSQSLKALREQRHLGLPDVAAYSKISARKLEAFERGLQKPTLNQLEKLATLYGVPTYALFADFIPNVPETLNRLQAIRSSAR